LCIDISSQLSMSTLSPHTTVLISLQWVLILSPIMCYSASNPESYGNSGTALCAAVPSCPRTIYSAEHCDPMLRELIIWV
jgi:hypothetical protein